MTTLPIHSRRKRCEGLTLLEILVAATLLIVIMGGLMAMFDQTQKVFITGLRQSDIQEGGRAAADLVGRDIEQMAAGGRAGDTNFFADWIGAPSVGVAVVEDPTGGGVVQDLFQQRLFFLTRSTEWSAIGYQVIDTNASPALMGSLYRYSTNAPNLNSTNSLREFLTGNVSTLIRDGHLSRVVDGVVHFRVSAYDSAGFRYGTTNITNLEVFQPTPTEVQAPYYAFRGNRLPSAVEIEIGVLEPASVIQARALPTPTALRQFLRDNSGKIQIFRQRVPIRVASGLGN